MCTSESFPACICSLSTHKIKHKVQPTDFSSWLSRAELEREREREREKGSVAINLPFSSRSLSLSLSRFLALALSRLAIRNQDNRWEPPLGSAWECSGIIASGTPSTITQRTHRLREVGWKTGETRQRLSAMAHKHGHGRERVSRY